MSLDELRRAFPPPEGARLLVHRGTCGDAVEAERYAESLRRDAGDAVVDTACDGACWAAPAATVLRNGHAHRFPRLDDHGIAGPLACLRGECDETGEGAGEEQNEVQSEVQSGVQSGVVGQTGLLARLGRTDATLAGALAAGAYAAAARALAMEPRAAIDVVEAAQLTGRGGAHFPTARKWGFAAAHGSPLLVVNAEEGEPGVFKDRHLMEGDPHRLLEGMIIAAHATGARRAYVYVNGQARSARARFERALAEAAAAGIVGGDALGAPVTIEVEVRSGAGGYVCGEETVILNSIEGERPVPRFKPPQITDTGLFGRPTLLHNVETLAAVTLCFDDKTRPPSKLIPLSGAVPRPGLYEPAIDGETTWANVLAGAGANPAEEVQALLVGGPSGVFVLPDAFDAPLEMAALGAGGTVALGHGADIAGIVRDLARYNARESCGECTPCREGTQRLVVLLEAPALDRPAVDGLIEVMTEASLCQLGGMAGRPVASAMTAFPQLFPQAPGGRP